MFHRRLDLIFESQYHGSISIYYQSLLKCSLTILLFVGFFSSFHVACSWEDSKTDSGTTDAAKDVISSENDELAGCPDPDNWHCVGTQLEYGCGAKCGTTWGIICDQHYGDGECQVGRLDIVGYKICASPMDVEKCEICLQAITRDCARHLEP
jgi:hypothetical protein